MIEKPILCGCCQAGEPRVFCSGWPMTCRDRLGYWLSGYIKGKDEAYQKGFDDALDKDMAAAESPTLPCPPPGAP